MSSTNRSVALALPGLADTMGRHPEDFYRTPWTAVDPVLPYLRTPRTWIDAGCGDGVIAERVLARWPDTLGIGVELDQERAQAARRLRCMIFTNDFLAVDPIWEAPVDLVISNPPYDAHTGNALSFLRRAIQLALPNDGEVAFLLRVGFLEAKRGSERDLFLEEHRPDVYLLSKRPRFTGDGGGDKATYFWGVWGPGRGDRFVRLRSPDEPAAGQPAGQEMLFAEGA